MNSLYILEIKPLPNVLLVNIFSHTVGFLFILLMFSLVMQKIFNVMQSHLFIFFFISFALGDISAKILLCQISEILLAMFYARIFMLSQLIFVFYPFEVILVCGVSWWSSFIFLHVAVQFSQHHLLKRLFLIHCMLVTPL